MSCALVVPAHTIRALIRASLQEVSPYAASTFLCTHFRTHTRLPEHFLCHHFVSNLCTFPVPHPVLSLLQDFSGPHSGFNARGQRPHAPVPATPAPGHFRSRVCFQPAHYGALMTAQPYADFVLALAIAFVVAVASDSRAERLSSQKLAFSITSFSLAITAFSPVLNPKGA
ncbi:hypothetical protein C8J57DRAFT_1537780 [Mycena rebaudengoi]|nr:hypothetical protein C8J57DRAFT_1537780 [Mycena rebaudengoi]